MTDTYSADFVNLPAFVDALKTVRASTANLKGPLDACARQAVTDAVATAPRLTGRMAGAHRVTGQAGNRVRITVDTPYAAAIHWGWTAHGIRRRPWVVATWQRNTAPLDKMGAALQADYDKATNAT
jgi:hypothetical protein